ncbi:MAG: lamin tail domain-containing protein, partial [Anaerolineales bacterium]|nr:lamin tail domain-containing protein [Anaerolineales bacterium]
MTRVRFLLVVSFLVGTIVALGQPPAGVGASNHNPSVSYVTHLGQGLGSAASRPPDPTQPVTVYARSDTALGENVCLEYTPDFVSYTRTTCTYSSALASGHGNWHCTIPAQPAGTTINYQLFTATDCLTPAGAGNYTGFLYNYTVVPACTGDVTDIKINELLYDQKGSGARVGNQEWLELVNTNPNSNSCVNLDNFGLDDLDTNTFSLPNIRLFGGDYLLLYMGRPSQTRAAPKDYSADFLFEDGIRPPLPPTPAQFGFVAWLNASTNIWNDGGDEVLLYVNNGGGLGYDSGTDTPVDVLQYEGGNDPIPAGFTWTSGCPSSAPSAPEGISISL